MILLSFTELSVTGADYRNIPLGEAKMHSLHAISLILLRGYPFFQLCIYFHVPSHTRPVNLLGFMALPPLLISLSNLIYNLLF